MERYDALGVFPAPAGMNRPQLLRRSPIKGVPRACGDEPATSMTIMIGIPCSPRLRG